MAANPLHATAEYRRLQEAERRERNWQRWGPYLADRQWGTVREDYSADGNCWHHFPHDHARSRVYRWGEDGLLGICDRECRLCFGLALWNGQDPILKERLFGLDGNEGLHGEDVKELYYHLDGVPTHSYMRALYKYPLGAFPYAQLVERNRGRSRQEPEFEIRDTGAFAEDHYLDVMVEYAKDGPDDLYIRLVLANRSRQPAHVCVLPTLWFRNTWIWGCEHEGCTLKPLIEPAGPGLLVTRHATLEPFALRCGADPAGLPPELIFTENISNSERLWGVKNPTPWVKDAFHEYVVQGRADAVSPHRSGTKAAALYRLAFAPGQTQTLYLRLTNTVAAAELTAAGADAVFSARRAEADAFYQAILPADSTVARTALAGLLWTKQFYHYSVHDWLRGDATMPAPPPERAKGRNSQWQLLFNRDIISMPDKWEYPWYAAWDLAFQMIPMAMVDPAFAKQQLLLLLREWYMHPNGQLPAYEFALGDTNPPVHAWACWRVYKMTAPEGQRDRAFLERAFHKLIINFTWWVNRKDPDGNNLFAGGFLGLDNVGVFDRGKPEDFGGQLLQADGTAWMAFYCTTMLAIALELARENPVYEDVASKFFEHFVAIADAMNHLGGTGLWDHQDGFYYDALATDTGTFPLRLRSTVGLVPLLAVEPLHRRDLEALPGFHRRLDWFLQHRADLADQVSYMRCSPDHEHLLLAVPSPERLRSVLAYLFSEDEFLSPYGIRSMSKYHLEHPYCFRHGHRSQQVVYTPGESTTELFGGNSNWRGPVWFPLNFLLVEALERYHHFFGDTFRIEYPTGSGNEVTLQQAANDISARLVRLFVPGPDGQSPCYGNDREYASDPHFQGLPLFHEYFHGDTGRGCGASHQTGWTALVAKLVHDLAQTPT